jgi:hypothetical protein
MCDEHVNVCEVVAAVAVVAVVAAAVVAVAVVMAMWDAGGREVFV